MKNNGTDGKVAGATDLPTTTAIDASLKRPWQTPEIMEEDYRETAGGAGLNDDGSFAYS